MQIESEAAGAVGPKKIAKAFKDGEDVVDQDVVGPMHKMNMGGYVVVLGGDRSYIHDKVAGQRTWINHEDGQYIMYTGGLPKESEVAGESEKVLKGNTFAILATQSDEETFNR